MVRPQRMARVRVQDAETGRGYPRRASSVGVGGLWGDIRRGMRAGAVPCRYGEKRDADRGGFAFAAGEKDEEGGDLFLSDSYEDVLYARD